MGTQQTYSGNAAPGPPGKPPRHRLRRILLVLLAVAVLIPAAGGAFLFSLGRNFDSQSTTIENPFPDESLRPLPNARPAQPLAGGAPGDVTGAAPGSGPAAGGTTAEGGTPAGGPAAAGALNILVMGSDSRGATPGEALSGTNSNQRADTLMLVHIPADRSRIYAVSLMRDLWVGIPGYGTAKINAALAYGGVPLMVQTVESLFHQRIDHVAMIDFEGFKDLTDALDGVEVTITQPFVSLHGKFTFTEGPAVLDGEHALAFVRERYAFIDGDYQRVRNQQAFVKALLAKNLSAGTLLNPFKVSEALSAISPFISVDSGLNAAALARLALELRGVGPGDLVFFTLPTTGTGTSSDGQSIVLPDWDAVAAMGQALAGDSLDTFVANRGLAGGD
ncbi:LCP family protein [Pseudarthrobacter sp. NPDC092419]|uniref:LCP family protein n=1 Tax=Pseudarthrobacter sp. NPDC092419 TaxID=3364414 RepID=UPI0038232D29